MYKYIYFDSNTNIFAEFESKMETLESLHNFFIDTINCDLPEEILKEMNDEETDNFLIDLESSPNSIKDCFYEKVISERNKYTFNYLDEFKEVELLGYSYKRCLFKEKNKQFIITDKDSVIPLLVNISNNCSIELFNIK